MGTQWGRSPSGSPSRPAADDFGPYERFLDQGIWWPSRALQGEDITPIGEMVPQYAVGAYHKLVRWARTAPAGDIAAVDDIDMREEAVKHSLLGRTLAARALGMSEPQMHAVYGDAVQSAQAKPEAVLASVLTTLIQHYPSWDDKERIKTAYVLTEDLLKEFIVKNRRTE